MREAGAETRPSDAMSTSEGAIKGYVGRWLAELHGLFSGPADRLAPWRLMVLEYDGGQVAHLRTRKGSETVPLGEAKAARSIPAERTVLRLSPRSVVQRTLTLPRGERRDIEAIIRNQIEFLAPWPPEKVVFDFEVEPARGDDTRMVPVSVTMTGVDQLDATLARLRSMGIEPGVVDAGTDTASEPRIDLLRTRRQAASKPGRGIAAALLVLALGALGTAAYGARDLYALYRENAQLQERIASVQSVAAEAERLGREAAEAERRRLRLADRKRREPAVVLVVEALSRTLEQHTHLVGLEVRGKEVRLAGKTPNAAEIIGLLERTRYFTNVRFAAPTTREAGEEIDTFTIVAEVADLAELTEPVQ
jgi:general secretion pathway protein L